MLENFSDGREIQGELSVKMRTRLYKIEAVDTDFTSTTETVQFVQAIHAIESVATITMIGGKTESGFIIGIDENSLAKTTPDGVDVVSTTTLINVIQSATASTATTVVPVNNFEITFN